MAIKTIPIFLPGDKVVWVTAGPTRELPDGYKLVRCAEEIPVAPDRVLVDIATRDFSPFDGLQIMLELPRIIDALERGEKVYVGCMGGTGRTGTLLAILAGQHPGLNGDQAIDYIRSVYRAHAVETQEQEAQVRRFSELEFTEDDDAASTGDYDWVPAPAPGLLARFRAWLTRPFRAG